jgi:AcrR family transcriptional regulator
MTPAERIVDAAKQCFAAKGFARTTVADIEAAAGYTPRSGGIYRHFPSKVAILEAVIDAELAANTREILDVPAPDPAAEPSQVLEQVIRRGLDQLDRQADLMRIVFRDLDRFEPMLAKVRSGLTDATYRDFADRLAAAHLAGAIPELDFEAVAVLAIGPVVDFKIKQHLLGYTPLDLDQERLVHAWVHLFTTVLIGPQP